MKNNSLSTKGLSLSEAQSISNLCNQRAIEIENKLSQVNSCEKSITHNGKGYLTQVGIKLPLNTKDLLIEKGTLHACQAFLMENIKAKDVMLESIKNQRADISIVKMPIEPDFIDSNLSRQVDESFGWSQLSVNELNEYYQSEALAAHIGKFIHKGSKLESLRNEAVNMKSIEWMELETGKKTPVEIKSNHTSEELSAIHEELAAIHRQYEQRTNYFKAKVKNLTTEENARIAGVNKIESNRVNDENYVINNQYKKDMEVYNNEVSKIKNQFEEYRQQEIKRISALRIQIDSRFQSIIDMFLVK
jgi:hypothetical protein